MVDVEMRRLRWRCRRGLLENDLLLTRFLARFEDGLGVDEQALLERLLAFDDTDLWDVLSGRAECGDAGLQRMVDLIRAA